MDYMMNNNQVQTLNYSAHAIEEFLQWQVKLEDSAPESAKMFGGLAALLKESVKFILPNCCGFIAYEEVKQAHLDLTRLPFPCVAFEIPWEHEPDGITHIGGIPQAPATKRIALCWEPEAGAHIFPELNDILKSFPDGGCFVMPIYWGPENPIWTAALGGSFIPYENTVTSINFDEIPSVSKLAFESIHDVGRMSKKSQQLRAEPFRLFPEIFEQAVAYLGSIEKAFAQIIVDCQDEVFSVVQACSVINCANVTSVDIEAPSKINKKRIAKGKQPFFSYKVLQLSDEVNQQKGNHGGSHASPRMHLRRGHLRRLKDKLIWVRPALINAGSKSGAVEKDYVL